MRQTYLPLASALIGAPLFILIALYFVLLPPEGGAPWGPWPFVGAGLALVGAVVAELVGYRTTPVPPGTDLATSRRLSQERWQTGAILRFAITEAPFILSIALAFVVYTPQPFLLVVFAAVVAVPSMAFHIWPWSRPVTKVAEALERDGGRTPLREDLGILTAR